VSLFEKIFNKILLQEAATWNTGLPAVFVGSDFLKPTQRHRKIIKDPGFRKHVQTVPDMHKVDPKSLQVLQDLKISNSGRKVLSQDELEKVCKQYGVTRVNPQTPKMLGNTGITLKFEPTVNGYILQK